MRLQSQHLKVVNPRLIHVTQAVIWTCMRPNSGHEPRPNAQELPQRLLYALLHVVIPAHQLREGSPVARRPLDGFSMAVCRMSATFIVNNMIRGTHQKKSMGLQGSL